MIGATKELGTSSAVEDYVKTIYKIESWAATAVTTNVLAARLGVSASSASGMVRKLADAGLVEHERYHGVRLTEAGRRLALRVLRRHRLIELYLTEALGMTWDQVHDQAELLEHALTAEVEELIAEKLGDPVRDPHGDPIPTRDGRVVEKPARSLAELAPGAKGELVRVSDSDPEMLRFLSACGVAIGDEVEVLERQPFGGGLLVRFAGDVRSIGPALASAMRVELSA
ncbi:MAG: metal-dependent transcriptional regulator [Nocardioidaceae bacterium]